jgi:death-on-curing protein
MSWEWVLKSVVLALHDNQLMRHGGASGLRDEGLLDSALARPQNLAAYGTADVFILAAAYAFGIAKNHPFTDGNKRAAFITAIVFLEVNGFEFTASEVDVVLKVLELAAGEVSEEDFANWLRAHSKPA